MDGYTYQENLLTSFHKRMGYEVEVIASTEGFDKDGKTCFDLTLGEYVNEDGIKVTRLKYSFPQKINYKLRHYNGVYNAVKKSAPDVIFIHNCQFISISAVVKYLKKNKVKVFVDNHGDFSNSAKNIVSKNIVHKIIWKSCAKRIEPFATKFFGVLPARVDFLKDVYGLPKEKCELLVMGADDEKISDSELKITRVIKRNEYNVEEKIVLMTGGKIDHNKPQTLTLMKAINEYDNENIKLIVFGSVVPELKEEFDSLLSEKILYIGWKTPSELYGELAVADIVAFPGLHSVLWEQTVAMGKPCIFKKIPGATHIDIGGNCLYFEEDSVDEYKKKIKDAIINMEELKKNAMKDERKQFLYSNIARRSIGE